MAKVIRSSEGLIVIGVNGKLALYDPPRPSCVCKSCGKCVACLKAAERRRKRKAPTQPRQPWELAA